MAVSIRSFLLFGFGGLLFAALGITLFLGFYSATQNTYSLLTDKARFLIDTNIGKVQQELDPVELQAKWIVTAFRNKAVSLDDEEKLEAFLVGSLATTPDVGAIFIATPDGRGYRVRQSTRNLSTIADISGAHGVMDAVERTRNQSGPKWEEPIWLEEISDAAINLRTPLIVDNEYIGMLVQVNSVSELSRTIVKNDGEAEGIGNNSDEYVPFILYDSAYILAHPDMIRKKYQGTEEIPLPSLSEFGDQRLARFNEVKIHDYISESKYSLGGAISGELSVGDSQYLYLYKTIDGYADKPITVGAYINIDTVSDELLLLYDSMFFAAVVMILSVLIAMWLSRKISKPVSDIETAVEAVNREAYDEVPKIPHGLLLEFNNAAQALNTMVDGLKEKEIIQDLFGRVVPSGVAEQMLKNPGGLKPQKLTATVLFSDLAKFTSISEQLQPEEIVELLNEYFSVMTDIIRENGGIVTQFQGDAVLAVFNVPLEDKDHAKNAIKAAEQMAHAMDKMEISGIKLKCRIGVNTGLLVAGNVGAEKRMNYTVHGDAVNLAARLEQLNKEYNTTVLVSGSTVEMSGAANLKSLGTVTVRGKSQPVEIYTMDQPVSLD